MATKRSSSGRWFRRVVAVGALAALAACGGGSLALVPDDASADANSPGIDARARSSPDAGKGNDGSVKSDAVSGKDGPSGDDGGRKADAPTGADAPTAADSGDDVRPPPACSPHCPDENRCTAADQCASGVCTGGVCAAPSCAPTCSDGSMCGASGDCGSGVCTNGTCAAPTCAPTCPDESACGGDGDCASGVCTAGTCGAPTCSPSCPDGRPCGAAADCASGVCTLGTCAPPSCAPTCPPDSVCGASADCASQTCTDGACAPPACSPACVDSSPCGAATDCASEVCADSTCAPPACAPTCADGNVCGADGDCGSGACADGVCAKPACAPSCADKSPCGSSGDCASGICTGGTCAPPACSPTCADGNVCGASDDCGSGVCRNGTCASPACGPTCPPMHACGADGDCASGVCTSGACAPPACSPTCNDGAACGASGDCASDVCTSATCAPPACAPTCAEGNVCGADGDCASSHCVSGTCAPPACSPTCPDDNFCEASSECASGYCSTLDGKCVAGQSCVGLAASAPILDLDGQPDPNATGEHAGLDTCGRGESTDAAHSHESCCRSLVIPSSALSTAGVVAGTRLDKYEVTAGRMRQFIETVSAEELPLTGNEYDLQDWLIAQFEADEATPATAVGARFSAQAAAVGVSVKTLIGLFPNVWYGSDTVTNIVALLGGTTMDPAYPSELQGCYVDDDAYGATTYWWPATTNQKVNPPLVGGDVAGDAPRPYSQDYYDIKSMNCAPFWVYAAFCAWDGGVVATIDELEAVYGTAAYPWGADMLPTPYSYTTADTGMPPTAHHFQNFVPGTTYYVGGASTLGAVDITVNWNNNSYNENYGNFYYYPNGGAGPTDQPDSVASGLDLTPYIAAPGRFYLDATTLVSPSFAGNESWQDLGANMLEMTSTPTGSTGAFCDCSTGGQASPNATCNTVDINPNPPAGVSTKSCPNSTVGNVSYPILRAGGTPLPSIRWEGGSWEGHETADPAATPPYFGDSEYSEYIQAQYGKAGFRCARAPLP